MRFGSVCSGIEAASVAWNPLGWEAAWLAEIEPFPSAVLAHHYPDVPNLGDMTTITRRVLTGEVEAPDVFTGGTPCQAFSVAGKRESLADERGNLSLTFCEIANAIDHVRAARGESPCIVMWENVPGVLSTRDNAFGCFLGALAGSGCELQPPGGRWADAGCVYGPTRAVAWRVLDAQYFGLAQRRRRVFVVASARAGFDPAEVLFEREGVRRDSPPRRETGARAPIGTLGGTSPGGGWRFGDDEAAAGQLIPTTGELSHCLNAGGMGRQDYETETMVVHTLRGEGFDASEGGTGRGTPLVPVAFSCKDHGADAGELSPTLRAMGHGASHANAGGQVAVAFHAEAQADQLPTAGRDTSIPDALTCSQRVAVTAGMAVRRLTPEECEALQGFPRNYTRIPWRNKPASECPDGPRYKALGNSWAAPCARWIGRRIDRAVAALEARRAAA